MRNYKPEGRFYIIMREDLPSLNPGKAMAQAAHAQGVAETFFTYIGNEHRKASWIEWKKQGYGGFGTTIVLGNQYSGGPNKGNFLNVDDIGELAHVNVYPKPDGPRYYTSAIKDPTYPIRDGNTIHLVKDVITCASIFIDDMTDIHPSTQTFLRNFNLYA